MEDRKDKNENPDVHITEGLDTDQIDRWIQGNIDGTNPTAMIPLSGNTVTFLHNHALKIAETLVAYK